MGAANGKCRPLSSHCTHSSSRRETAGRHRAALRCRGASRGGQSSARTRPISSHSASGVGAEAGREGIKPPTPTSLGPAAPRRAEGPSRCVRAVGPPPSPRVTDGPPTLLDPNSHGDPRGAPRTGVPHIAPSQCAQTRTHQCPQPRDPRSEVWGEGGKGGGVPAPLPALGGGRGGAVRGRLWAPLRSAPLGLRPPPPRPFIPGLNLGCARAAASPPAPSGTRFLRSLQLA